MEGIKKINEKTNSEISEEHIIGDELGVMMWKLESLENFYPCYKSMIKKE